MTEYRWLSSEEWSKVIGQFRLQVGEVLSVFDMHGMGIYTKGAVDEIVELAIQLTQRIRGKDKPIRLNNKKNPRGIK